MNTGTVVMNVLFGVMIITGFFIMRYRLMKLREMSELGRPLLGSRGGTASHRLDTATREAAKGYNRCAVCAFENFKASRFCTICGESIVALEEDAYGDGGRKQREAGVELHQSSASINAENPPTIVKAGLTQRQIRARKRKEWTRKLDIEGKMFWYREYASAAEDSLNPGFVVSFHTTSEPAPSPASAHKPRALSPSSSLEEEKEEREEVVLDVDEPEWPEDSLGRQGSVSNNTSDGAAEGDVHETENTPTETPPQPERTSPDKTQTAMRKTPLRFLEEEMFVRVVEASKADAAVLATASIGGSGAPVVLDAIERKKEIVAHAAQDFPTKFAHFVVSTAALLVPADVEFLKVSVHRAFVLEESMDHLSCIEERFIRSVMRINFIDESGVDAGGLHREWFMLLNELLMEPSTGLFVCTNKSEQVYALNPNSHRDNGEDHLVYYYAAGRLVGRALLEGVVLNFHLAVPLLKIILGIPVTMDDLEYLDPETYKSMQWIAEHDDIESLALDFSVTTQYEESGEVEVVDLIPNGRNIPVTNANKRQYLERKFHYMVFESVSAQLHVFLKGIYEVVPSSLLALFDAEELDYLLCGSQEIDVENWIKWSMHSQYLEVTSVLKTFWDIVREMPNEYRRRLLQFTTGCARVPLVGFRGLTSYDGKVCPFTIKSIPADAPQYVRSQACFNRIDLPLGLTKKELRDMLYAILDTEAYGFTTH